MSTDKYAVLGNPIKHSQSPGIHQQFALQTGQNLSYEALEGPLDGFKDFVDSLAEKGYRGMNITVPFKEQAWALCHRRSERAERAGAVNTLIRKEGRWYGENTDGTGLLNDLQINTGLSLRDKKILLLGAGGAVRGVILPLLNAQPASLHIANRTVAKALNLAEDFATEGPISASGFELNIGTPFDLIINGTAASLSGSVPPIPPQTLNENTLCYDMMYAATPTAFMRWGSLHGAQTRDGLGMLVEQAAESFFLWRGAEVDTTPVLSQLRALIQA